MGRKRIKVIMIRKILTLFLQEELTRHKIAQRLNAPRSTVRRYVNQAESFGLTLKELQQLSDEALRKRLFSKTKSVTKTEPEWKLIQAELKKKGVTLQLLWEEYTTIAANAYCYSEFCKRFQQWRKQNKYWLPHTHIPGENLFVDYSGLTILYFDIQTKRELKAEVFVSCLGASNFIYCEATASQSLEHWIGSHTRAFEFYGGVTQLLVPDNLKSGVTRAHRYDAVINPTYEACANYYGATILPTRVRSPKDKAKVENAVQQVERRILAVLRHRKFFSIAEINIAIRPLLEELNHRIMKQYQASRYELFIKLEKSALKPLPATPFEFATWSNEKVNGGYHIKANEHFYSVPHSHIGDVVNIKLGEHHVEIFYRQERIALHVRDDTPYQYTTIPAHRPKAHQEYLAWTKEKILQEAERIGEPTHKLVQRWFQQATEHTKRIEKRALGIVRLRKVYSSKRINAAADRAYQFNVKTFHDVELILKNGLDKNEPPEPESTAPQDHEFVRGADYYDNNDEEN